jgi:leucyl-tRNA synthetase
MELYNELNRFANSHNIQDGAQNQAIVQEALEACVLMLQPIVPHMSHVLWQHLGKEGAAIDATWPLHDESALEQTSIQVVVQVNGKLRSKLEVAADIGKDEMQTAALEDENVKRFLEGTTIRKVIVVPGKLVNIVAN